MILLYQKTTSARKGGGGPVGNLTGLLLVDAVSFLYRCFSCASSPDRI